MIPGNVRVSTVHFTGDEERWLHVAHDGTKPIMDCGLLHTEEFNFLNCQVASRWVIMRAR